MFIHIDAVLGHGDGEHMPPRGRTCRMCICIYTFMYMYTYMYMYKDIHAF